MKMILIIILSLLALSQTEALSKNDFEWEMFKITYAKDYSSQSEEVKRMNIFLDNLQIIINHNEKYVKGEVSFKAGINKYSDLTHEEISSHRKGYRQSRKNKETEYPIFSSEIKIPASLDWRAKGAVTPVKDQQNCGSCWAFSATGSLEGQHFLKKKELVSLSEQNLVDCASVNGCNGDNFEDAFNYVIKKGGIDTEKSYPYKGIFGKCHFNPNTTGAAMKRYVQIPSGNESALLETVASVGPVSVAIDATDDLFNSYSGGVYEAENCSSTELDHGVLVVGYGTTKDGKDYWLVKNSWSTSWGLQGYILMPRNRDNYCGIATDAVYPVV